MQIQTVFKAGNSNVVAIPKDIKEELKLEKGSKVVVERLPGEEAFIVKKADTKKAKTSETEREFNKWLKKVLKEDAEILDELAVR